MIKEGDLYKVIEIEGRTFEIRYGYYEPELERGKMDPIPVFPNFLKEPLRTADGYPFATADQEICRYFKSKPKISGEGWCNDCEFLEKLEDFLGICKNEKNKIKRR